MFYITIAFAGVYMTYYHFSGTGLSSAELYEQEMEEAEANIQAYLARQESPVDENSVEVLTDENQLAMGKTLYETNCVACHGYLGEGGVGPNLTDEYWIHGGTINDIFKTIKYGVPEKGMISWQAQLRPKDMQQVSSYIMTLVGTNPPNGKEPQGEKMEATPTDTEAPQDSSQAQAIGMNE
jgi:cytochrome c oxidase cbb3-type subunit 3